MLTNDLRKGSKAATARRIGKPPTGSICPHCSGHSPRFSKFLTSICVSIPIEFSAILPYHLFPPKIMLHHRLESSSLRWFGFTGWISLLCLVSSPLDLQAADWPQWGGTDARNMASPEQGIPETFVPGKKKPTRLGHRPGDHSQCQVGCPARHADFRQSGHRRRPSLSGHQRRIATRFSGSVNAGGLGDVPRTGHRQAALATNRSAS